MSGELKYRPSDPGAMLRGIRFPLGASLANLRNRGHAKEKRSSSPTASGHPCLNRRMSLSVSDISSMSDDRINRQLVPENELARQSKSDQSSQSSYLGSLGGKTGISGGGSIGDLMNSGDFRSTGGNWPPRTCSPITLSMVNVSERRSTESLHPRSTSPCSPAMTTHRHHTPKHPKTAAGKAGKPSRATHHPSCNHQDSFHSCVFTLSIDEPDSSPGASDEDSRGTNIPEAAQGDEVKGQGGGVAGNRSSRGSRRCVGLGGRSKIEEAALHAKRCGSSRGPDLKPRYLEHKVPHYAVESSSHLRKSERTKLPPDGFRADDPHLQYDPGPEELVTARTTSQLESYPGAPEDLPSEFKDVMDSQDLRMWSPVLRPARADKGRDSKKMSMAERTQMLAHLIHDQHQRCSKESSLFVVSFITTAHRRLCLIYMSSPNISSGN
ncbi:uncharacterized protein [Procambarus clarkii]|uniref:uncharacterized protein n=1 Tax=Procambarus clarkii TaxID=6728 RepID=UPI0037432E01